MITLLLSRLLVAALDQLPGHELVVTDADWQALCTKYTLQPDAAGGLMLTTDAGAMTAKLADHEDKAVMLDKARGQGFTILDGPGITMGVHLGDEP